MTVLNELSKIAYIGDSSQTLYPIPFEYINVDNIYVSIYTNNNEFVENWTYSNQYIIENSNVKVLSGFEIDNTKKLLIIRVIDAVQDNRYREGGDFPAKSTETSFDKLTMLIQQHQEVLDRCVKVEVLDNQTPEELLAEVYDKLDSATEIAEEAVDAANAATQAVESAEKTLREVTTYVDTSKSEINTLVTDATNNINSTVTAATTNIDNTINQAVEDVKAEAVSAAEGAIQDAANTAIQIVTEHANAVIIPPLQGYVDSARESATSAEESSLSASASALSASQSASKALASETNAKNSASEAALHNLKNKITNCITEIPQDIKLELNDGTLTLKAGSKVYVPNGKNADGSLRFDVVVVDSDISITSTGSATNIQMIYYGTKNKGLLTRLIGECFSGAAKPTTTNQYAMWYDTSNNLIKYTEDTGGSWITNEISLPVAIISKTSGAWTSIDQVFNGFGYIGSTVFALPNVKGLIPNGRNADGSLKNIEFVTDKVLTDSKSNSGNRHTKVFLYQNSIVTWGSDNQNVMYYKTRPSLSPVTYCTAFIEDENKWIRSLDGTTWIEELHCVDVCDYKLSNGAATSFQPKLPFRAVDYNEASGLGMPSSKYINLTLGASGSTYTAPANGWVIISQQASSSNTSVSLANTSAGELQTTSKSTSGTNDTYIPVKAHDTFRAFYIGSITKFRFIYAEGDK